MTLTEAIQQISLGAQRASQPTDLCTGTVTGADPLEITIDDTMQVIQSQLLHLTVSVIEKKIPVLNHQHYISTLSHTHTCPTGATAPGLTGKYITETSLVSSGASSALQSEDIVCYENGEALPIQDGYIVLNRALEEGDKVLLLRVRGGQEFVVLSRIFQGGGG